MNAGRTRTVLVIACIALAACQSDRDAASSARPTPEVPAAWGAGRAATPAEIAAWDLDVNASGAGLPPGQGTHAEGALIYTQKCAVCHGARAEGTGKGPTAVPKLVGREPRSGFPFGNDVKLAKTVGNYWPYATTVYDYMRRAMPLNAPGSLTPHELYSLSAFLLAENEIISKETVMDAKSLPAVRMPGRDHFMRDDRKGGAEFR